MSSRARLILPSLFATGLVIGCGDRSAAPSLDAAEAAPKTTTEVGALERAASEALTPRRQAQSYLTSTPIDGGLSPEALHAEPSIDGPTLQRARIAPSGEFATVLQGRADDAQQLDLWAYDLKSGEGRLLVSSTDLLGAPEELSEEEKNRRERARQYGRGIISYSWVGDDLLMFPLGGDIYLYDLKTNEPRQVTATPAFETDPKIGGKGEIIAYVRENELYVQDLKTGLERQLTSDATDTIRNATASFVVQEELGRSTGYWIAPGADRIAYTQIDESPVVIETRADIGADGIRMIDQRYPFAGTDNATVKLGIIGAKGGATRWLDLGDNPDIYLTRVAWSPDGNHVYAGVLARDHKTHMIYRYDAKTGERSEFYQETSPTWLNIRTPFKTTKTGLKIVSEREGSRAYYEITEDGATRLTPDGLLMQSVACEAKDAFFVTGWDEDPLSNHLYRVASVAAEANADEAVAETEDETPAEDGPAETAPAADMQAAPTALTATQITQGAGQHFVQFDKGCTRFMGSFSSDSQPRQVRAFEADGTPLTWLNENALNTDHPYAPYLDVHADPDYGTLKAEDGSDLYYQLYKPVDLEPGQRRASVTIVYGGPGVQRVMNRWERKHLARMLTHHGFVVFMIDGRGSTNRGKAFEDVLYREMGRAEVTDQAVGARWLKAQPFIDPDRMGVYGWSYGGYMTLMMLAQTDLYAAGVSGAPVTDWALYDTAYTERYLGDPRPDNANYTEGAYEKGSVFAHLDGLTEPVLVIHGMADDNVQFRHTVKLVDAMQKAGLHNATLEAYPGEKHGFRAPHARIHRDRSILEYFLAQLDVD